eukprot:CAMPEP_0182437942 /NCGR_PEP_ID=MMETSP1167-20130531/85388_1 /TAXON_ID=2988 /ORGANISM="Mallomonas Sp, Strain CCMP3275" /LENGTH=662 /DNA_ID=CAMNT_0024631047 /DNA_START=398 /DNA_END=2386 /DNA_ORIENTATION=-
MTANMTTVPRERTASGNFGQIQSSMTPNSKDRMEPNNNMSNLMRPPSNNSMRPRSCNATRPGSSNNFRHQRKPSFSGQELNGDDQYLDEDDLEDEFDPDSEDVMRESQMQNEILEEATKTIMRAHSQKKLIQDWPEPIEDDFVSLSDGTPWPQLERVPDEEVQRWIFKNERILIRTVTWNLQAKKPPPVEEVNMKLLPVNKFHLYFVGTEECERSIAKSVVNPSKKAWEAYVSSALGAIYMPICAHTLQAIHLVVYAHRALVPFISEVSSGAIATGLANTLGNKGGVAISMKIGHTRLIVLNAHLAAHQNGVAERNHQMNRIDRDMTALFHRKSGVNQGGGGGGGSGNSTPFSTTPQKTTTTVHSNTTNNSNSNSINPPYSSSGDGAVPGGIAAVSGGGGGGGGNTPSVTPVSVPVSAKDSLSSAQHIAVSKLPSSSIIPMIGSPALNPMRSNSMKVQPLNSSFNETAISTPPFRGGGAKVEPIMPSTQDSSRAISPAPARAQPVSTQLPTLAESADAVVIMGDLNYRIRGNRAVLDELLQLNLIDVLKSNDQLRWSKNLQYVFKDYAENEILFRPTYKFDKGKDTYDTGPKKRIPGWTDRILYSSPSAIECLTYNAEMTLRISDHRPVYATLSLKLDVEGFSGSDFQEFTASNTSQVCAIM